MDREGPKYLDLGNYFGGGSYLRDRFTSSLELSAIPYVYPCVLGPSMPFALALLVLEVQTASTPVPGRY